MAILRLKSYILQVLKKALCTWVWGLYCLSQFLHVSLCFPLSLCVTPYLSLSFPVSIFPCLSQFLHVFPCIFLSLLVSSAHTSVQSVSFKCNAHIFSTTAKLEIKMQFWLFLIFQLWEDWNFFKRHVKFSHAQVDQTTWLKF